MAQTTKALAYVLAPWVGLGLGTLVGTSNELPWYGVLVVAALTGSLLWLAVDLWLGGVDAREDERRRRVLDELLDELRQQGYETWAQQAGSALELAYSAGDEERCPVRIQAFWDARPGGPVRVVVHVGDPRLAPPLIDGFLLRPDGSTAPRQSGAGSVTALRPAAAPLPDGPDLPGMLPG